MKDLLFCYIGFFLLIASCSDYDGQEEIKSKRKNTSAIDYTKWSDYLGGPDRNHYTTLDQISPQNVAQLKVAWSYAARDSGQMQMNPIIVDSIVYGVSAGLQAFAIHAATGREIWSFGDSNKAWHSTSRGVAYWTDGSDQRILYTIGPHLYALNALTGELITSFGDGGRADLHEGMPVNAQEKFVISNTPGTIYKDLIVMPLRVSEGADAAPGDIRAFNVKTGELEWIFHTIPKPGDPGYETWELEKPNQEITIGGANNWAGMAMDHETGIIYVPTGTSSPDFYGGNRLGSNLYANCLLALNANTGERIWHFQFTHHDLWDRDPPATPNLITITRGGKKIKAVAQITKSGYIFLFDRLTGEPLFEIEEVPVPSSNLDGEKAWPTQPVPKLPKPFARQSYDMELNDISPYAENQEELLAILQNAKKELYATPDTQATLLFPGYDGAGEWGGAGADPEEGIMYVNSIEMAWVLQMEDVSKQAQASKAKGLYLQNCASCHRADLSGIPASGYPNLINIQSRLTRDDVDQMIVKGKGMMTGFPQLKKDQRVAIIDYILGQDKMEAPVSEAAQKADPYRHMGYNKFLDSNGLPAISPPWGTLHAIDMNTGDFLWTVPFGETYDLKAKGFPQTGCESYGGPIVTANGLLIIAGTKDGYIRAVDKYSGKTLWGYKLPAAGFATPSTYMIDGKQYIVIACGGEKLGTPAGNQIVAFAL